MTEQVKLTDKQKRFVDEYLIDLNATQAARRAGYSEKSARQAGSETLSKPYIQAELTRRREQMIEKTGVSPERVLEEYARIGFADIGNYYDLTGSMPIPDFSELGTKETAAISEIITETRKEPGEDGIVERVKFKMHDKKGSLDSIARHLGMFTDRAEVVVTDVASVIASRRERALEKAQAKNDPEASDD